MEWYDGLSGPSGHPRVIELVATDQGETRDTEAVLGQVQPEAAELRPGPRALGGSSGKHPSGE